MEKSKVEFVYKNISSLNKISIVNKKIFRILPYICVPSLAIGGIAVFLKEMLPIKGVLPNYIRLVCLVIFFLTFLMWLVSFFFEYIFLFLWKCPVCKGKFPWYKTTLGYLGEEGGSLVNKEVKDICDRKNKKISLIQYENSNLIIPKKCPHCGECIFRKNCASVPEERSAIPLQTEQNSAGRLITIGYSAIPARKFKAICLRCHST